MKKYLIISIGALALSACGGGGGGGTTPAPNSITGTWSNVAGVGSGYTPASASTPPPIGSLAYTGTGSLLYLANGSSQIWQYSSTATPNWSAFESLPAITSTVATNSIGTLYTGLSNGQVYTISNNAQIQVGSGTENSQVSSLLVVTGNATYLGNKAGNIWYNSGNSNWSQMTPPSGGFGASSTGIVQTAVDSLSSPAYLSVAAGSNVWACQLNSSNLGTCSSGWKNLTTSTTQYTDMGSPINAIAFYTDGVNDYGYIGNGAGHVWRSIAPASLPNSPTSFQEMTSNSVFPGYTGTAAITSLLVDGSNDVYVGTANGQVWLWTPGTKAWSSLTNSTFSGGTSQITSLTLTSPTSHTVYVGNANGQVWQVSWQGS